MFNLKIHFLEFAANELRLTEKLSVICTKIELNVCNAKAGLREFAKLNFGVYSEQSVCSQWRSER